MILVWTHKILYSHKQNKINNTTQKAHMNSQYIYIYNQFLFSNRKHLDNDI